jgi:hypothetical protein
MSTASTCTRPLTRRSGNYRIQEDRILRVRAADVDQTGVSKQKPPRLDAHEGPIKRTHVSSSRMGSNARSITELCATMPCFSGLRFSTGYAIEDLTRHSHEATRGRILQSLRLLQPLWMSTTDSTIP